MDGDRFTHNPEVGGSNPPPATSFRSSRPFPIRERAFCASRTVVKGVVGAGLRAAWQRDGGDGVTRDETAWTWWTPPLGISGCRAQRYRKRIPVSSRSCWTSRNMRRPVVGPRPPAACRGIRLPRVRDPPLLEFNDGTAGRRSADTATYFLQRALCRAVGLFWQAGRITDVGGSAALTLVSSGATYSNRAIRARLLPAACPRVSGGIVGWARWRLSWQAHLQFDHASGGVVTPGAHCLRWEPPIPILELANSHIGLALLPGPSCLATFQARSGASS